MHSQLNSQGLGSLPSARGACKRSLIANSKPCIRRDTRACASVKPVHEADVVIIGAGIIGLLTANELLKQGASVALVERKQLCAGATGAGQGYLWMAHRSPHTAGWDLAQASTALWRKSKQQDPALAAAIEWQDTGSLLLATSAQEAEMLEERAAMLAQQGLQARFIGSPEELRGLEPDLRLPGTGGAALLAPGDWQISGRQAAAALLAKCKEHGAKFTAALDEPVSRLHAAGSGPHSVETEQRVFKGRQATVVAAGVWSGDLLSAATGNDAYSRMLAPRRGHLLEVTCPGARVVHGMMEMSYTKHYSGAVASASQASTSGPPGPSSSPTATTATTGTTSQPHLSATPTQPEAAARGAHTEDEVDITFTATTSASGSLLVGSSREFSGYDNAASPAIVAAIMERAALFLPALGSIPNPTGQAVRVGLRPFARGGLPMIGPVPEHAGLYVAAGHEGSGLCLGTGTAALMVQYVLHGGQPGAAIAPGFTLSKFKELLPEHRLPLAEL